MTKDRLASIASDLSIYLLGVRKEIEDTGELEDNRFAKALYIVCTSVQCAILTPSIDEFADHLQSFTERKAREETERN